MAQWPTELQQCLEVSGFSESQRDTVIRSPVGYGPAKLRKRTTQPIDDISGIIYVEEADLDILKQFYEDNGSLTFDWIDFQTGLPASYRFRAAPTYRAIGGELYIANLQLELMP